MPHIHLMMYKGRDQETKEKIAKAMQETLMNVLNAPAEHISVSIEDTEPAGWKGLVNKKISKKDIFINSDFVKDCVNED